MFERIVVVSAEGNAVDLTRAAEHHASERGPAFGGDPTVIVAVVAVGQILDAVIRKTEQHVLAKGPSTGLRRQVAWREAAPFFDHEVVPAAGARSSTRRMNFAA